MKGEMRALTIIALAATLLLAGCGQKGPLYMPGENAAMVSEKPSKTANGESTPADTAPDAPEDES